MYLLAKICDTLWENLAGDKEILFLQYLLPGLKMIPSAKFEVNCMLHLGAVSSSFTPAQKLQLEEIFNFRHCKGKLKSPYTPILHGTLKRHLTKLKICCESSKSNEVRKGG